MSTPVAMRTTITEAAPSAEPTVTPSTLWGRWRSRRVAHAMAVVGALAIAAGFITHAQPFAALPGLDGAMTCGLLGFVLLLAQGIGYRRTLSSLLPVLMVQIGATVAYGSSAALIGAELLLFGIVGSVLSAYAAGADSPATTKSPATAADRPRRTRPSAAAG